MSTAEGRSQGNDRLRLAQLVIVFPMSSKGNRTKGENPTCKIL